MAVKHNLPISMAENQDGSQDGTNLDEELDLTEELELDGTEDVDTLREKLEEERKARLKEVEARKQLTARAKKAEDEAKKAKTTTTETTQTTTNRERKTDEQLDEYQELRLDGYNKQDAQFIINNGGRKILEDKNSYVAIALKAKKEQRDAEIAASQARDSSGQGGEGNQRKYTDEQLKGMSTEQLRKILPHAEQRD